MTVTIKANRLHDNGNGTFSVEIKDSEPLTPKQVEVLDELFPNLKESVFKVLTQEAVLGMIATDAEIAAPKKKAPTAPQSRTATAVLFTN